MGAVCMWILSEGGTVPSFRGLFRKPLFVAALCVWGCCGGVSLSECH